MKHHSSLETAYRTHLSAAVGYYQHLLFRLQQEFRLALPGVLDFHVVPDSRTPGQYVIININLIFKSPKQKTKKKKSKML